MVNVNLEEEVKVREAILRDLRRELATVVVYCLGDAQLAVQDVVRNTEACAYGQGYCMVLSSSGLLCVVLSRFCDLCHIDLWDLSSFSLKLPSPISPSLFCTANSL